MVMWFSSEESPDIDEIEDQYWSAVEDRDYHVCVNAGSIDAGTWGHGFKCDKNSPTAKHPWNLKMLTNNHGSILRSMGSVVGKCICHFLV